MKPRVLIAICVLLGLTVATTAVFGEGADALKKAQSAFDTAQSDYLAGKFDEAAAGFQEAYAARPFPQFLYNVGASFHMKGKKSSDAAAYGKAVEFYKRYLSEEPNASDKPKVEKAIGVLEAEIARLKQATAGAGSGSGSGSAAAAPSQEVQNLGDVKVRGLVVIVTEPQNATIYLDDKKKGPFATTPWSGSVDGDHKIIIEKRGYKVVESTISADPTKLVQFVSSMAQEDYLAWVEIASNIPKSDVFIDDKTVGAVGQTPWSQQIKPGKHTFWISTDGYDEYKEEVDVIAGETHAVKAQLKGAPVGKIDVIGLGIEDSTIRIDGKVACERGPCLKALQQGEHTITVSRPGFKSYSRRVSIQAKTQMQVKVNLAPTPSRSDAVVAYVLAAGFTGGGIFLGLQSQHYRDDLKKEIAAGNPPPDPNDSRFTKGKAFAIAADATFVIAGITALTAVYYTFRDKGAPSTALIDVRALALQPQIGPGYAGLGMEVSW